MSYYESGTRVGYLKSISGSNDDGDQFYSSKSVDVVNHPGKIILYTSHELLIKGYKCTHKESVEVD